MNASAFHRTTQSMASTLSRVGRQLPHQDVRVLCTACSGSVLGPRRLVCVGGEYYWLNADTTYQQLINGIPPSELELEPIDPDEDGETL